MKSRTVWCGNFFEKCEKYHYNYIEKCEKYHYNYIEKCKRGDFDAI